MGYREGMGQDTALTTSIPVKPGWPPLLHPLSLCAIVLMGLNDQIWKYAYPSYLTGKLSDFMGLVFFPLLLEYLFRSRLLSVVVTGVGFTLAKTTVFGNDLYNAVYEAMFQVFGWGHPVRLIADPEDCLTLIALLVPLFLIPKKESLNENH